MKVRLTWNTGRLWLGALPLAQIRHTRKWGWQWTIYGDWRTAGDGQCEALEELARAECFSAVASRLREVGIEVEL